MRGDGWSYLPYTRYVLQVRKSRNSVFTRAKEQLNGYSSLHLDGSRPPQQIKVEEREATGRTEQRWVATIGVKKTWHQIDSYITYTTAWEKRRLTWNFGKALKQRTRMVIRALIQKGTLSLLLELGKIQNVFNLYLSIFQCYTCRSHETWSMPPTRQAWGKISRESKTGRTPETWLYDAAHCLWLHVSSAYDF